MTPEVKVQVLMVQVDEEKIATKRPIVQQFVVDRSKLKQKDDWLVIGNSLKILTIEGVAEVVRTVTGPEKKSPKVQPGEIALRTVYWRFSNKKHKDFRRTTSTIMKANGEELPLGLIEYYFMAEEHAVSPHKHKRSGKPFHPTAPSTKKLIKELATGVQGPSSIYSEATAAAGSMQSCEMASDLPRDVQQVKFFRKTLKKKNKESDFMNLLDMTQRVSYLKGLQWTPQPRIVFSYSEVLGEIIELCCQPTSTVPLCIDTTYHIGNMFVASTTYQNTKLIYRKTNKFANLPGPAMFHVRETKEDFIYFSQTLIQQNEMFEQLKYLGSDRGQALKGFQQPLKGVTMVPCAKHVQDDIKVKMTSLGITGSERQEIMFDIFGNECKFEKGLVDSETVADFDAKLEVLTKKWDTIEKGIDKTPQFSNYFLQFVSKDMKLGMLPPVRRDIGVGNDFFYNNASECIHFKFKCKVREHNAQVQPGYGNNLKCSWVEAIDIYQNLVTQISQNVQLSVVDKGPYELAPRFRHLKMTHQAWTKLNLEERRRHLARIDSLSKVPHTIPRL